jgi:hypothetical protein
MILTAPKERFFAHFNLQAFGIDVMGVKVGNFFGREVVAYYGNDISPRHKSTKRPIRRRLRHRQQFYLSFQRGFQLRQTPQYQ